MLAIRVEYLTGVCMATRHNDPSRSTPEWPPHPDRLYSALVAAADPEDCDNERAAALHWLAKQGAPQLAASEARRREAPEVHMPVNPHEDEVWQKPKKGKPRTPQRSFDLKTLLPVHRKKAALPIPAVIPDNPIVHFIWPDAEPEEAVVSALRAICEQVTYLGRSRSLVSVRLVDGPPPPTHVPDPLGQVQLRVPDANRLCYLIDKYRRDGGKPEPSSPERYRPVNEIGSESALGTDFERCWVFQPKQGDPLLPIVSTVKVTRAMRAALIRCITDSGFEVPDIVHGHGEHPHCAYVALPYVHASQRHADGAIKGLAVLLPRNPAYETLCIIARGMMRLQENGLNIPGIGAWRLQEVPADSPPMHTLNVETWTRPSRIWTTATPMIFGHFPKSKNGGEPGVILESLRMIGVSPEHVLEVAVGRHSPLYGAQPSWCFKSQGNSTLGDGSPRHVRHVTLRFRRAVRGPLALGCMRFFGLGLMRPVEEHTWQR